MKKQYQTMQVPSFLWHARQLDPDTGLAQTPDVAYTVRDESGVLDF
jgi:hypothetical protein